VSNLFGEYVHNLEYLLLSCLRCRLATNPTSSLECHVAMKNRRL